MPTSCSRSSTSSTRAIAWFTLWQAIVSTVLTLTAALPLTWALSRFRFRGRSVVEALVLVPFVLPTVVVATAFLALLPDAAERTVWAILLAHVFFNVAVVVRVVGAFWAGLDGGASDLAAVGLDGLDEVPVRLLSTGQRRRAGLARVAASGAPLWLLDEPHAGLDAAGRDVVDELVADAARRGATVVVVSHELERAAALAGRSVTVAGGRTGAPGTPEPSPEAAGVA